MTATALFQRPHWGVNGWRARSETDQRDVSPLKKWRHNATRQTYSSSLYFVRYLLTPTRSTRISRMPIANRSDAFESSPVTHLPHSVKCPSAKPESLFAATKYLTRRFGTRKFSDAERWCNPKGGMLPDRQQLSIHRSFRIRQKRTGHLVTVRTLHIRQSRLHMPLPSGFFL